MPEGIKKEPELTKKAHFWDSRAQGLILNSFYQHQRQLLPKMSLKLVRKPCLFRGRLENRELRVDYGGASGSRIGPSRKADKNGEQSICEPTHLQDRFENLEVAFDISLVEQIDRLFFHWS